MSKRAAGLQISYNENTESSDTDEDSTLPNMAATNENKPQLVKKRPGRKKADPDNQKAKQATTDAQGETQKVSKATRGAARGAKSGGRGRGGKTRSERPPLKEIDNAQAHTDADELDELDDLGANEKLTPISMAKTNATKAAVAPMEEAEGRKEAEEPEKKQPKRRGPRAKKEKEQQVEEIPETQPEAAAQSRLAKATKPSARQKPRPAVKESIPETQPDAMEVDEPENTEDLRAPSAEALKRTTSRARSDSRPRQTPAAPAPRRGGSVSDTERAGDTTLRRRFNELSNKFETLDLKYRNLRDVGVQEAQDNFDRIKQQTDERANASLRNELDTQRSNNEELFGTRGELTNLTNQTKTLTKDKKTLTDENKTLTNENKTLQSSLQSAQNEIKTLQAKLAASRSGSESGTKAPPMNPARGAGLNSGKHNGAVGSAEQAREAQKRALKEELYGDLTSLLVLGVKRREKDPGAGASGKGKEKIEEGEDVYDCIQTGRNGTLHFHLSVANAPPQGTSYDDAEFAYTPLLDEKRDADLIDLLPDYLAEEICFPRKQTAMFYRRIYECMNKRPEPEMVEQVDVHEEANDDTGVDG
ncbi:MAG: hypothetical protein M1831_005182 [Alyxoria varia]|nr:MAG: hypothetical protein M1831_005182 [Alyxoria varia]